MCDKRGAYNIGFKQYDDLANRFNLPKDSYKCAAPTLQMTMKWLRKEHRLHIIPRISRNTFLYGFKVINNKGNIYYVNNFVFDSYEEACEAAIKYCLENLI